MSISKNRKSHMRVHCLIILMCLAGLNAFSQQTEKEKALLAMQELSNRYRDPAGLRFDLMYRYAKEEAPGDYLDSLRGQFRISGNRFWYKIDQTESICTDNYVILLFAEDHIMYLAKPSQNTALANPIAMLDSLLTRNEHVSCQVAEDDRHKTIRLDFPAGAPCKRAEYQIDRKTGYLVRMTTTVRAEMLYEATARPLLEETPAYAIVEAVFSAYQRGQVDEKLFDPGRYFKKEGSAFVAVAPYDHYQVFIGSPGLGSAQ